MTVHPVQREEGNKWEGGGGRGKGELVGKGKGVEGYGSGRVCRVGRRKWRASTGVRGHVLSNNSSSKCISEIQNIHFRKHLLTYVYACMRACIRSFVRACMRACISSCVRALVRACVH